MIEDGNRICWIHINLIFINKTEQVGGDYNNVNDVCEIIESVRSNCMKAEVVLNSYKHFVNIVFSVIIFENVWHWNVIK